MSLVNDMLRDLDRRRRMPAGHGSARLVHDDTDTGVNSSKKIIAGLVFLLTVAIAVAGYIYVDSNVPQAQPAVATTPVAAENTGNASQAIAQAEESSASPSPSSAALNTPPAITARVAGERRRNNGFELRFEVTEEVAFDVQSRTDSSITILFSEVGSLTNQITSLQGVEIEQVSNGLLVSLDMERETDFVVYENTSAMAFSVVIEGFWQVMPAITSVSEDGSPAAAMIAEEETDAVSTQVTVTNASAPVARPELARTSDWVAPVRTQRELSLQERDRNASQQALRQAQSGQMQAANISLYEFISKNPEAHQSRNTLVTLLYAQQEYDQAGLLLEEGLSLAPNLSSYKKMKARLLMMNGQNQQAIELLRNVPPVVTEDKEYYELLASLYQQTGDYMAAVSTYQSLIRTDSNVGRWWTGMAISHESMGNVRDAINSFEVALQISSLESSLRQYSRNRIKSLSGQ